MRIGIYGGSFNPIHLGHEQIAKYVLKELKLDKLLIIPVGIPSHRENNLNNSNLRFELCKIVFENENKIEVLDIEIKKNKISYTYDTLLEIRKVYGEKNNFFEIIGEDSLNNFTTWKNYKEILSLSTLVVLRRKDYTNININFKNIIYLNNPYYNFSSTEIRKKIQEGKDISILVNPKIKNILLKKTIN